MSQPSLTYKHIQDILTQVAAKRSHDRWRNIGAVLGILLVALLGGLAAVALFDPPHAVENTGFLAGAALAIVLIPVYIIITPVLVIISVFINTIAFVFYFCLGVPTVGFVIIVLFLYLWSQLINSRRRMMLSLIQTAMETGTPPAEMIRVQAATSSRGFRNALYSLAHSLEQGKSLAVALSQSPRLARYDVCGILALGKDEAQTLGVLDEISRDPRNRTLSESNSIFRAGYLLALIIPIIAVAIFMMMWIIPKFMAIFADFDVHLPFLTLVYVNICEFFIDFWYLLAPIIPLLIVALMFYLLMQSDTISVRPPGLRRLFRSIDAARFLRIFSTGLKNQVPIPDSIDTYHRVTVSEYLKNIANRINKKIRSGGDWIEAFRKSGMVTTGESRLLETAQRAGNLPAVVDQIAYSKELQQSGTGDLVSKFIFIPCILLIGVLIGSFVIAMFLPMIELIKALA